mmetsp:Transcript_25717/g.57819  ORF Transcript_25717/g.57819 Transcript_25717/m.57819 type:complete len:258 (-) Transcript_25717:3077-3850(-)
MYNRTSRSAPRLLQSSRLTLDLELAEGSANSMIDNFVDVSCSGKKSCRPELDLLHELLPGQILPLLRSSPPRLLNCCEGMPGIGESDVAVLVDVCPLEQTFELTSGHGEIHSCPHQHRVLHEVLLVHPPHVPPLMLEDRMHSFARREVVLQGIAQLSVDEQPHLHKLHLPPCPLVCFLSSPSVSSHPFPLLSPRVSSLPPSSLLYSLPPSSLSSSERFPPVHELHESDERIPIDRHADDFVTNLQCHPERCVLERFS